METNFRLELINLIVALPFVVTGVLLFANAFKITTRFFYKNYRGNTGESFKDSLTSTLYIGLSITLLLIGAFVAVGEFNVWVLVLGLVFVIFLLPIGVLGSYWQKYLTEKMFGGSLPVAGSMYVFYEEPESSIEKKMNPSQLKTPRREKITAAIIALHVFGSIFYLLNEKPWINYDWADILIKMAVCFLIAYAVNKIILSSQRTRRARKLRDGESIEDD